MLYIGRFFTQSYCSMEKFWSKIMLFGLWHITNGFGKSCIIILYLCFTGQNTGFKSHVGRKYKVIYHPLIKLKTKTNFIPNSCSKVSMASDFPFFFFCWQFLFSKNKQPRGKIPSQTDVWIVWKQK